MLLALPATNLNINKRGVIKTQIKNLITYQKDLKPYSKAIEMEIPVSRCLINSLPDLSYSQIYDTGYQYTDLKKM